MKEWEIRGTIFGAVLLFLRYSWISYLGILIILICIFPKNRFK